MTNKYEIIIFWDKNDEIYIAEVPELPGCIAHGDSEESALKNVKDTIVLWITTAKETGDTIPEPKGERLIFA